MRNVALEDGSHFAGRNNHVNTSPMRQSAMITSAQKNEIKSLYVPIGGVPGCAFRTAAKAKSKAAVNENIASSTLRPRRTQLNVRSNTAIVNPHIMEITNNEKNLVVAAREIVMSIPT